MYTSTDRAEYVEEITDAVRGVYSAWPAGSPLHAAVPGYVARVVSEALMAARSLGDQEIRSLVHDGLTAAGHTDPALIDLVTGVALSDPTFEHYPSRH